MNYSIFQTSFLCLLIFTIMVTPMFSQNCTINGEAEVCANSVITYLYDGDYDPTTQSIEWEVSSGAVFENGQNFGESVTIEFPNRGMYLLKAKLLQAGIEIAVCEKMLQVNSEVIFMISHDKDDYGGMENIPTCIGDNLDVEASVPEFPAGYSYDDFNYSWYSVPTGLSFSDPTNHETSVSIDQLGTYKICVEIDGPVGCTQTHCFMNTFEVIDNSSSVVDFEVIKGIDNATGQIEVCGTQEILFKNNSAIDAEDDWKWTITDGNYVWTYTSKHLRFPFPNQGSYEVSLQWELNENCTSNSVTKNIEVIDGNPINIICPTVVCEGDIIEYIAEGVQCASYNWEVSPNGTIVEDNGTSIKVEWNSEGELGYGYVIFTPDDCNGGCISPAVEFVPIIPSSIEISGSANLCGEMGSEYELPFWQGAMYTWSIDEMTPQTPEVSLVGTGNTRVLEADPGYIGLVEITVQIDHPVSGCTTVATKEVDIFNSDITGEEDICVEEIEATFELTSTTNKEVHWMLFRGPDMSGPAIADEVNTDNSWTFPISGTIPEAGIYTVVATIEGSNMSTCMLERQVNFYDPIRAHQEIHGPTKVCPESTHTYYITQLGAETNWELFIDGVSEEVFLDKNSIEITWPVDFDKAQIQVYRHINGNCHSLMTSLIVEPIENPIDIDGDQSPCPESIVEYSTEYDGSPSYTWTLVPANSGSIVSGQGTPVIEVKWHSVNSMETVEVKLEAEVCGTIEDASHMVTLEPIEISLNGESDVCQNVETTYDVGNVTESEQVKWYVDSELEDDGNSLEFKHIFSTPGAHTILVEVHTCGGIYKSTFETTVIEAPYAFITQSELLSCPEESPFTINLSTPHSSGNEYEWKFEGTDIPGTMNSITISDEGSGGYGTGTYEVIVTRSTGGIECTTSDVHEVSYFCKESPPECCPSPAEIEQNLLVSATVSSGNNIECGTVLINGSRSDQDKSATLYYPTSDGRGQDSDDFGPGEIIEDVTLNMTEVGTFFVHLVADGSCSDGSGDCKVMETTSFKIPYIADFDYEIICNLNSYDLKLVDKSKSMEPHGSSWFIDGSLWPSSADEVTIFNVTPGSTVNVERRLRNSNLNYTCNFVQTIEIPAFPTAEFSADMSPGCLGTPIEFKPDISNEQVLSYNWTFGDGSESQLENPVKVYSSDGNYTVELEIETIDGCLITHQEVVNVVVNDLDGYIDQNSDPFLCFSQTELEFNQTSGDAIHSYNWSPTGENVNPINITEEGVYELTVTDVNNCMWMSDPIHIEFEDPFYGDLQDREVCHSSGSNYRFNVIGNSSFEYDWEVIPSANFSTSTFTDPNGNLRIALTISDPSVDVYTIKVTAKVETGVGMYEDCEVLTSEFVVNPTPVTPSLSQEVVECDPFLARINQSPHPEVLWNGPGFNNHESEFIFANQSGEYTATAINQYGCESSASVTIEATGLNDLLTGCYELCLEEVENDEIVLFGVDYEVSSWEWYFDDGSGAVTRESGTNSVPSDYTVGINDIPGEIYLKIIAENGCVYVSDPFCIEEGPCHDCPDETIGLLTQQVRCLIGVEPPPNGGDYFDNMVFEIDVSTPVDFLPDGFSFCSKNPEITWEGATMTYITNSVGGGDYNIRGVLTITDLNLFRQNDAVVYGEVYVCDSEGNECPIEVSLDLGGQYDAMCDLDGIMCMNWRVCFSSESPVGENSTEQWFCMWLPFVEGGNGMECDLDEYTINVYDKSKNPPELITSDIVSATTLPSTERWCSAVTIPDSELANHPGLEIEVIPNCGGEGCTFEYFPQGNEGNGNCTSGEPIEDDGAGTGAGFRSNSHNGNIYSEKISVVPNPSYPGIVNVLYNEANKPDKISVIDIQGKVVKTITGKEIGDKSTGINLQDAVAGFYYILLEDEQSNVNMKKLVIIE